ncbi:MAG: UDP-N-acetylmuramate--L-alanine ligase [Clostridium sp.]|nr:UDP-N-acetylmuramate--L-alanine ligase [Acetatifactor muris]MCM1525866.1 UDP-N-acetylmuramate--L-alanine ligase [Bacteroides sp.]MCM1562594.1 UDP-N-acetylmuramate--L-alanine ligase [Clostridium sp.]
MYKIDFSHPSFIYFVGIGGISMSGLAEILADAGFQVAGSDRSPSPLTERLEQKGIHILYGQRAANITPDIDCVIFTSAIRPDNPEYVATLEQNIPHLTRAELLGQLMRNYRHSIAVSGTHGKTTTTSMVSEILLQAGADPTLSIGGIYKSIGGNIRVGGSECFVTEACEYTNSFLSFFPTIGIILNIEEDHMDFFKDLADIRHSFRRFAELIPADGCLIINADIPDYREITEGLDCQVITWSLTDTSVDYYPTEIRYDGQGHISFLAHGPLFQESPAAPPSKAVSPAPRPVTLQVSGEHNVSNALAALALADRMQVDPKISVKALGDFTGTDRRFELKGSIGGVTIIDDYAHHPTEITATLKAAANYPHKTLWCVFQPHTYTRTKAFMEDFAKALCMADKVVLADIFAARETDTLGISSRTLQERVRAAGGECYYFPTFDEIENFLLKNCTKGDLLITMGAGDVQKIGENLLGI